MQEESLENEVLSELISIKISNKKMTQAEFDAIWKNIMPHTDLVYNCLDDNHCYGEYTVKNGKKTATCEFCGTTITVNDCSCNCHSKNSFIAFFWKILNFLQKLFGTNRTCACGVAHY